MKEKTGRVVARVPVDVGTYLLNEKREILFNLEQRHKLSVALIPSPSLETPHYEITRVRVDELGGEQGASSHKLLAADLEAEERVAEELFSGKDKVAEAETPAVQSIAPQAPAPVVIREPVAAPVAPGLIRRLWGSLFGKGEETPPPQEQAAESAERSRSTGANRGRERSRAAGGTRRRGSAARRGDTDKRSGQRQARRPPSSETGEVSGTGEVKDSKPEAADVTGESAPTPAEQQAGTENRSPQRREGESGQRSGQRRGRRGGRRRSSQRRSAEQTQGQKESAPGEAATSAPREPRTEAPPAAESAAPAAKQASVTPIPERTGAATQPPKESDTASRPAEPKPAKAPDTAADSKPTAIGDE